MLNCTEDIISNVGLLMSLWKHECYRVIADRFTSYTDKDWFEKTIKQVSSCHIVNNTPENKYFQNMLGMSVILEKFDII